MGKVRIIGGTHRSRIITFKDEVNGLRPTGDRVKQTLFNWLGNDLTSKVCLDAFAGSGSLGFEALSLGAKEVVMLESNKAVFLELKENQKRLSFDNLQIINTKAANFFKTCSTKFDLIFLDPPYTSDCLAESLELILAAKILKDGGLIYLECDKILAVNGFKILKQKKAGVVHFYLLEAV